MINSLNREALTLQLGNRQLPIDGAVAVLRERLRRHFRPISPRDIIDEGISDLQNTLNKTLAINSTG